MTEVPVTTIPETLMPMDDPISVEHREKLILLKKGKTIPEVSSEKNPVTVPTIPPTLMPMDDPIYVEYLEKLILHCPEITFFTQVPAGMPAHFDGGLYQFMMSIPIQIEVRRQKTGSHRFTIMNQLLLANIITPPKYKELEKYSHNKDYDHLEMWLQEVQETNENYFKVQEYCKDKNIILFETLYIDQVLRRIKSLRIEE